MEESEPMALDGRQDGPAEREYQAFIPNNFLSRMVGSFK
jgi:hypothetical protein